MKKIPLILSFLALMNLGVTPAFAAAKTKPAPAAPAKEAQPKSRNLGKFGNWSAYVAYEGKNPVCYMALPLHTADAKARRAAATLMITHRPAESSTDVVSFAAGQKFKGGTDVEARVGEKKFDLFTKDDTAWARDAMTDKAIVGAMRASSGMLFLSGTGADGKTISEMVSLKGAAEAYYEASKACGMQAEKPRAAAPVPAKAEAKKAAKPAASKAAKAQPQTAKKEVKKTAPAKGKAAPASPKDKKTSEKSKASKHPVHEKK